MAVKIWTSDIKNCYVWSTAVKWIYCWTTKVRPSGWKPWANTLAYYTFDTQTLLNSKTNTVDATRYSWSWSYSTWYKWQWYSANISSWWPIALSSKLPSWDFTICSCLKFNSYPPSSSQLWWWFWNLGSNRNAVHAQFYSGQHFQIRIYDWSSDWTANEFNPWRLSANTRYRFVMTRTWTTIKLYINWSLNWSWTNTISNTQTATYYIWTCYDTSRRFNWQIDNVIIENRAWSDDEVRAYDNLIK